MCGIAGWIGCLDDDERVADRMAASLAHRGPDARGKRSWREATLVHTRLSILDLTLAGQQPMSNEDGTVWVVFNGEIYNHHVLRRSLERRGHRFKGRSDTEVLPHLYEEDGASFVNKLRGMFALAVYDTRTKTLLLARDRFGIKPLFYAPSPKRMAFASEIRALLEIPEVDRRPDRQAISDYAALFYIPAPETLYTGIRALEPGEILEGRLDADRVRWNVRRYHQWSTAVDSSLSLEEATDASETLLSEAVSRQLESDVPIGAFLSGGIDSSLISAVAQEAVACTKLRTFNIAFSERRFDESAAALDVATAIGSDHTTLLMEDKAGTWQTVTDLLLHCGQPFADTSLFATHAVCSLGRQQVTTALSGDGGDEGFGGYDENRRIARLAKLQVFPSLAWRLARRAALYSAEWPGTPQHWPHRFHLLAGSNDIDLIRNTWCGLAADEHRRLCRVDDVDPVERLFAPQWEHQLPKNASRQQRLHAHLAETNTRLNLANDFLFKVDTASMREGLEVRVPMLDEDLFGFCLTLPHGLKFQGRTNKRVLRRLALRRLPRGIARNPKHGFAVPVDTWVDADFRDRVKECLSDRSSGLAEYFRPEVYWPIVEAFCDRRPTRGLSRSGTFARVVMLLALHLNLESCKSRLPSTSAVEPVLTAKADC